MDCTSEPIPVAEPEAVTPTDLIGLARSARGRRERAERDALTVAQQWAVSHEVEGPWRREQGGAPGQPGQGTGEFPDAASAEPDALITALERAVREPGADAGLATSGPVWTSCDQGVAEVEQAEERRRWRGLPELRWDCAAPLAAALGLSTRAGWTLLRQAMTLEHRLPRTMALWEAGATETRPARLVAEAVAGQPDDVCAWVDTHVARRINRSARIGEVVLERLVTQALTELHAEELELARQEKLLARYARHAIGFDNADGRPGPDVFGLAEFAIRGEWPDIYAFDAALAALAEALRRGDGPEASEPLDVRRSIAVGILADPARAAAMLGLIAPVGDSPTLAPNAQRKQRILLTFHLAADAVAGAVRAGMAPVGTDDDGRPWLDTIVREWAGRPDVALIVRPVIHCGGCEDCDSFCDERHQRHSYSPTDLDRERMALRTPRCVFPFCTMPIRRCDCDHIVPFDPGDPGDPGADPGGPTCPKCNLAPLCRHHHRIKTHAGWTYRAIEPGLFRWSEPHGQSFLTSRWGTRDLTDAEPERAP